MKRKALHIQKGGTGKTSLAGNCAYYAASVGTRTVLVDGDPQGNASSWFINAPIQYELADVLQGGAKVSETVVQLTDDFYIVPTAGIGGDLKKYSETQLFHEPFVFEDLNTELEKQGFDLAVYDLSPGLSQLERCILLSCDEVVSPMTPEYFSIDGLEAFGLAVKEINHAYRRSVRHLKLVINMMNRRFRQHVENAERLESLDLEIFTVPQDRGIADGQANHQSIFEFNPRSRSIESLKNLTAAIMGG